MTYRKMVQRVLMARKIACQHACRQGLPCQCGGACQSEEIAESCQGMGRSAGELNSYVQAFQRGLRNRLRVMLTSGSMDTKVFAQARDEIVKAMGTTADLDKWLQGQPFFDESRLYGYYDWLFTTPNIERQVKLIWGLTQNQLRDNLLAAFEGKSPPHKALSPAAAYKSLRS